MPLDNQVQQHIVNATDEVLIAMLDKPSEYLPEAIALAQWQAAQRGGEARLRAAAVTAMAHSKARLGKRQGTFCVA